MSLVRPDDPTWESCLRGARHDVYHLPGYHDFEQSLGNGEPYLLLVEQGQRGLAWPYLLRQVESATGGDSGLTDVTSVYGYPGPVIWGAEPGDAFLSQAWQEVCSVWRQQRAVAAFTRFHPLLDNAAVAEGFEPGQSEADRSVGVVEQGPTLTVDCSLSDEEVFATYHRSLRQHLRVSRRKGLVTEEDPDWRDLEAFTAVYRETMARNRAAHFYLFSLGDFARLRDALRGHAHLLVTRLDGAVAAAGIFTEMDGIVQAHLVASSAAFRLLSPTKVLLDDARCWARERGNDVLHLGGGRGGREDSLFRFKSEFSSRRHAFNTGRWVLDRPMYEELAAAHAIASPGPVDPDFFPAYRAPVNAEEESVEAGSRR